MEQQREDPKEITLREATLFHQRCVRTFRLELPENVDLRYWGPLSRDIGRQKQVVHQDEVPFSLFWSVEDSLRIFSFWISTVRTIDTLAVCNIEGKKLYVNIYGIDRDRSPDENLDELGGKTVRETLKLLEREPGLENNDEWFKKRDDRSTQPTPIPKAPSPAPHHTEHGIFGDGSGSEWPSPPGNALDKLIEIIKREHELERASHRVKSGDA